MIAEILATGEELRTGAVVDRNTAHIAAELEEMGLEVTRHSCVGDHLENLKAALREMAGRADVAVVTGGLGPTEDDLTSAAAAEAADCPLVLDEEALTATEDYFKRRAFPMSSTNRKQAYLPQGAQRLDNPVVTASVFVLTIQRCHFFFLPGVPREMEIMLAEQVLPRIARLQGSSRCYRRQRVLSVFGLGESATSERIEALASLFPGVSAGLRAHFPIIQVKLYAQGDVAQRLDHLLDEASAWVGRQFGRKVFAAGPERMEAVVGRMLREGNATVAVAESCTGGLIAHRLTNVPGSSDYFLYAGVTYANRAKIDQLGVRPDTLRRWGAVHEETVRQMAEGVKRVSAATYGLATSGIAGPSGGTPQKPVGTVCIGLATPAGSRAYRYNLSFGERTLNKTIFAVQALDVLRRELLRPIQANA